MGFNRAMLFNVGATEALKQHDYQCFIFHDVDLMPEDDRNIYSCPVQPRHMSVAIDTFMYQLPYDGIFGGVSAMKLEHFRQVNGFSNKYLGWGGEGDDMRNRLVSKKLYISRYPANIARYKMLGHAKQKVNSDRFKILYTGAKRMDTDGYNSLVYKRVQLTLYLIVDYQHGGTIYLFIRACFAQFCNYYFKNKIGCDEEKDMLILYETITPFLPIL